MYFKNDIIEIIDNGIYNNTYNDHEILIGQRFRVELDVSLLNKFVVIFGRKNGVWERVSLAFDQVILHRRPMINWIKFILYKIGNHMNSLLYKKTVRNL